MNVKKNESRVSMQMPEGDKCVTTVTMFCKYVTVKAANLNGTERFGTAHAYRFAAVSFLKFLGGNDIGIHRINAELIKSYERYLLANNKANNTISFYMRSLRSVYNQAIEEKIFKPRKANEKPFSGVFTGYAKTQKRAISAENVSLLMKLDEVKQPSLLQSLHLFLFSFYTQGMSFADMANLKKENIKGDVIRYNRKKTGQQITIALLECMKIIIGYYSDFKSDYIFPILRSCEHGSEYEKWKKTASALAAFNKNLAILAKSAGITARLTSYVARHTWATLASLEGIPLATISKGMGHESEKTTRIYISQLDFSDVERANRKILSRFTENISLSKTAHRSWYKGLFHKISSLQSYKLFDKISVNMA